MTHIRLLPLVLVRLAGSVNAEIEKVATPTNTDIQFQWWPKVLPPTGWHFDAGSSHHFGFNAIAPDGSTFSKAKTVMYAKADYKPRVPETKSLAQLIDGDIADFHHAYPGMAVTVEPPVLTADHKPLKLVTFAPSAGGNWERVAYGEEAEFYVLFTLSSRSKSALEHAMPAFKAMVASYRVGP
jgi:hypothetical protein